MKKSLLFPIVTLILAAALLFGLSFGLNSIATRNAQKEHLRIMQTLLPGSETFTVEPYTGEDEAICSVHKGETGFVVETAVQGYADEIRLLVGVSKEGYVTGLVVKEMHETFGLGAQAIQDWQFLSQFLKTEGDAAVGTQVDALSGATVTSKAITKAVNSAVAYVTGADIDSGATSWGG